MNMSTFKGYLEEFNYPNISFLTDKQLAGIFTAENRFFLLTWLAKLLNSQFEVPSEWSKVAEITFADFFHECGFCASSQKLAFVRGDASLRNKDQNIIFNRIFDFIKSTTVNKENIQSDSTMNVVKDVESFSSNNTNLFPELGSVKQSLKERQKKVTYFTGEIEKLQKNIECNTLNNEKDYLDQNSFEIEPELEMNFEKLSKQAIHLQKIASVVNSTKRNHETPVKAAFSPCIGDKLIDCNTKLAEVLEYFKTTNLIQCVNTKDMPVGTHIKHGEMSEILEYSSEVVSILRKRDE